MTCRVPDSLFFNLISKSLILSILRLVFAVAGVEFEDFRIDGDWQDRKKGEGLSGQT